MKEYLSKNEKRIKLLHRVYYQRNRDRLNAYKKQYCVTHQFVLDFTSRINTLKKLIPIIIYKLGIPKNKDRTERAKTFIRKHLCPNCKTKYLSHWNNDFFSIKTIICDKCQSSIINAIDKQQVNRKLLYIIRANKLKAKAIQFELELKLNKPFNQIMRDWYLKKRMSSYQITEKLQKEFNIFDITNRGVECWLLKLGILRPQVKAVRLRVVTKRMDYAKRKIDYANRQIDYQKRSRRIKANMLSQYPFRVIRLPQSFKKDIHDIANKSHRTMSEVVRDILRITKGRIPGRKGEYPRWQVVEYGLKHLRQILLRGRLKSKRAYWVSLMFEERKICKSCGKQFMPSNKKGLISFCSKKCRRDHRRSLLV